MELAAKLDEHGKGAWIALMVVAFIVFWPLGLAMLAYMIWSGRMGCSMRGRGRWHNCRGKGSRNSSGNTAFDEYRAETLRRLEEEQEAFQAFLDRLRRAKDKSEFDQFMDEQQRSDGTAKNEAGPAAGTSG